MQISKINLKPTQEESYSPKLFKTTQEQERNLAVETFDYKFEMYDINNNYIPVELEQTVKSLVVEINKLELVKTFNI